MKNLISILVILTLMGLVFCSACSEGKKVPEPPDVTEAPPVDIAPAVPDIPGAADSDSDGFADDGDNCPAVANPQQEDMNSNKKGDHCEDQDADGLVDASDNCSNVKNVDQANTDNDTEGDACDSDIDGDGLENEGDNCPLVANPGQEDADNNGVGNPCENDSDGDGFSDELDNCPNVANADQANNDNALEPDGAKLGDLCDDDDDNDGVLDIEDTCVFLANFDEAQLDTDGDGFGDLCDDDDDDDTVPDETDNCPFVANIGQENIDGDSEGDLCDNEMDGDGFPNDQDNCPSIANSNQANNDYVWEPLEAKLGDVCDDNDDLDNILDVDDNCPFIANQSQDDNDSDGEGNPCDLDDDNDTVADLDDNCPFVANLLQDDADGDGTGDLCEGDFDSDGVIDDNDNCIQVWNAQQNDNDSDNIGDLCDNDMDGDGLLNDQDNCQFMANIDQCDVDNNAIGDKCDQDIIWISPTGTGDGTLGNPFGSFADAITSAQSSGKEKLFVKMGTYNENINLPEGLKVYGGFHEDAQDVFYCDPKNFKTIIQGQANSPVFTISGDPESENSVLYGLEIKATASTDAEPITTAILANGSLQIDNSVIITPDTPNGGTVGLKIVPDNFGEEIVVEDSTITVGDPSGSGSYVVGIIGITEVGAPQGTFRIKLINNEISAFGASWVYGVTFSGQNNMAYIADNTISVANAAKMAMGVRAWPKFNQFYANRNEILVNGGAIQYAYGIQLGNVYSPVITSNGIYLENSPVVTNAYGLDLQANRPVINQNTVRITSGNNVYGIWLDVSLAASLENNIIYVLGTNPKNIKVTDHGTGGLYLRNNLVAPQALFIEDNFFGVATNDSVITQSPWSANYVAINNITDQDVQFDGTAGASPFNLLNSSPAVNAGKDNQSSYIPVSWADIINYNTDLKGDPRSLGGAFDIGAYEIE